MIMISDIISSPKTYSSSPSWVLQKLVWGIFMEKEIEIDDVMKQKVKGDPFN